MTKHYPTKQFLNEVISNREFAEGVPPEIIIVMVRQLIASMEQEPVAEICQAHEYGVDGELTHNRDIDYHQDDIDRLPVGTKLYAAPQLPQPVPEHLAAVATLESEGYTWHGGQLWKPPIGKAPAYITGEQPAVVDVDDNFYSWFGREWHEHYQHNQYTTAAKQTLGVMAESAWKAGRSAAILQAGNSPVAMDGWKVEAERLAEIHGCSFVVFRHGEEPQCSDPTKVIISFTDKGLGYSDAGSATATYDCQCRACRPVTMNDMRFVVCPECGNKRCPHANDHNNACTGSNEPGQAGSAYPAVIRDEMKMGARLTKHRFKP
ncbi:hypothetical protein [Citrobacter sp. Igbk 17]|uniref:hypothetical protein n=1 Tax=Citrobacter sp. Igbk 17 TaxID=2963957 RepID=UPI0023046D25|nr:hypothetical protein [Citrobacter sp. Igbk 17]MDA8498751.1 hypothetical protein [Citrobacter sp. Igbk 17]